jgi:hypothetical protein
MRGLIRMYALLTGVFCIYFDARKVPKNMKAAVAGQYWMKKRSCKLGPPPSDTTRQQHALTTSCLPPAKPHPAVQSSRSPCLFAHGTGIGMKGIICLRITAVLKMSTWHKGGPSGTNVRGQQGEEKLKPRRTLFLCARFEEWHPKVSHVLSKSLSNVVH